MLDCTLGVLSQGGHGWLTRDRIKTAYDGKLIAYDEAKSGALAQAYFDQPRYFLASCSSAHASFSASRC